MKVLVLILLMTGVVSAADIKDWKGIAGVSGMDKITQIHVRNLLLSYDIESLMEGSLICGISVPPNKAEQAIKLLRADAPKGGYYVWFGGNDVVKATEPKARVSRISISSVLKQPEFASETGLGKFLRSKELAKLTAKYSYIISMSVHERQYLTAPKTCATGYDVMIELRKPFWKQDDGYRGSYQVYDGGSSVGFLGSNEWQSGGK